MTGHLLDRPVWNALTTRQAHLAQGAGAARRLAADYGIFAASADTSAVSLAALADLVPAEGNLAIVETTVRPPPPGVAVSEPAALCQMIAVDLKAAPAVDDDILDLTEADAPAMLALATLTRPGPFYARTHELGAFVGVKIDDRLVAMAGERMRMPGLAEVSGVCTHPDHRGRGYAAALMGVVAGRMLAKGERPFLHVYAHNTGAISLYRTLGYEIRREMLITMLSRG